MRPGTLRLQKKVNTLAECRIRLVIPAKAGIQRKIASAARRFPAFFTIG
ncbi:MAG: hypothetical protein ACYC54_13285 [Sedimentisphaerales bacterium]